MKLTYEDKLEIYRLWKEESFGFERISQKTGIKEAFQGFFI